MTNDEIAEMIAERNGNQRFCKNCDDCCHPYNSTDDCFKSAMQAMQWKDKERKELWRITRNRWQEWAIEQLTAFAIHLQKCGAFRDDLCMDIEHEAQSFIEFQKYNAKQKEL